MRKHALTRKPRTHPTFLDSLDRDHRPPVRRRRSRRVDLRELLTTTVIAMTQAPGLHNFYVFPIVARLRDMKKRVCDAEADWCDKNPYWTMPKYLLGNLF